MIDWLKFFEWQVQKIKFVVLFELQKLFGRIKLLNRNVLEFWKIRFKTFEIGPNILRNSVLYVSLNFNDFAPFLFELEQDDLCGFEIRSDSRKTIRLHKTPQISSNNSLPFRMEIPYWVDHKALLFQISTTFFAFGK